MHSALRARLTSAYAKAHGYAFAHQDTKPFRALFVCDRAGKYNPKGKSSNMHPSKRHSIAHPAYRIASITAETRVAISSLAKAGILNAQIFSTLREEALGTSVSLLSKDISNLVQTERKRELGGKTPIQWLIEVYILSSFQIYYL
ncbi:uncharacterized protein RAG0_02809 [Rhynchosporium agropyri]|uniref:Uncharacterized protein n=1 Tax=Rhynchosporium agropyri TaxID=914238 RepID=A0A1E1K2N7_9HELO|nr:uncharacterized protein RAG0_02809 [Rhynchosporium agropyri]